MANRVARAWFPPAPVRVAEWVPKNIVIPNETETPGLFDLNLFPHVLGVLEAVDDPMIRRIYLEWAARCAKTFTGLSILVCLSVIAPRPAMLGGPTIDTADDVVRTKLYPLLEACKDTAGQVLPDHMRNPAYVALRDCRIRRANSGSPKSMAGFPACYGLATEVSGWSKKKSSEADSLKLFWQRGRLYPFESKYIFESTPGTKGECRIDELMTSSSTQRRHRWVPCPHCEEFQRLVMGSDDPKSPGLKWLKAKSGRSNIQLAEESAWYRCALHGCRIENHQRPEMMRAGVWLPEGQSINRRGKISGQPLIESPNVGFGPLSALYSLVISGWGQIAVEWLSACETKEGRREFTNGVMGEVYDPQARKLQPHELADRLQTDDPIGVCPPWSVFLSQTVDVGGAADEFHWQVCAWGPHARGHVVDYGTCYGEAALEEHIRTAEYPHADGGRPLRVSYTLIDSGSGLHTEPVYAFCRRVPGCVPSKGMNGFAEFLRVVDLGETDIKQRRRKQGRRLAGRGQQLLYEINHERSQKWIQAIVDGDVGSERPDRFTIAQEVALEVNGPFLDHLLNEYAAGSAERAGQIVHTWKRAGDNEQRDLARGNRALADFLMNHGQRWASIQRIATPAAPKPPEVERTEVAVAARDYSDFSAR